MTIKNLLLVALFGLLTSGLVDQVKASQTLPETQSEIKVTGRLFRHNSDRAYRLKLDKEMVFSEGSRSERRVGELKLRAPQGLQEKVRDLVGREVMVEGTMRCTMHFSPWTAECDVEVKKIAVAE